MNVFQHIKMYSLVDAPKFQHPFTAICTGCTKSGKTEWTKKFVRYAQELMNPPPEQIIWCYSEYQPGYKSLLDNPKVKLNEGLPNLDELKSSSDIPKLLILDDLMMEGDGKKGGVTQLFIKGAHHWSCSVLHIVQNLFFGGLRTARINAHYMILMKNPSDKLQVATLARQLYPGNSHCLLEAFKDATQKPYGYLLVDMSPETPEELRLRTNVFPGEYQVVYVPSS